MQREVFEAFLTDPIRIDEDVFSLWLEGLNAGDALTVRLQTPAVAVPVLGGADKLRELLWRDSVDQYRLFEKLEHYLMRPSLFRSQLLFQIPPRQQHFMVERYYSLDEAVGRWLVGRKLSAKLQKDLDEVSDHARQTLKSCRRQLENLRRVHGAMEDRNFQGVVSKQIGEQFLVSDALASVYACVLFLQHARLEVHPTSDAAGFLGWRDLVFFAALIMTHWVPQRRAISTLQRPAPSTQHASQRPASPSKGVVENGAGIAWRSEQQWPAIELLRDRLVPSSVRATVGLDLSARMTNSLRDLKAHLINDSDVLVVYRRHVMDRVTAATNAREQPSDSLGQLKVKLYLVVHGLLTIGAGLSQPKEMKDFLGNLVTMVVRVLHDCRVDKPGIDTLFIALIESLAELEVWYLNDCETRSLLLASWETFLSVCRVVVVCVYDQYAERQAPSPASLYS